MHRLSRHELRVSPLLSGDSGLLSGGAASTSRQSICCVSCEPGTLATPNHAYLMSASAYVHAQFSPEQIFLLAGTSRCSSIYFLFPSRAAQPQGRFLLIAQVGFRQTRGFVPLWRTLSRHFSGKCLKYLYHLGFKRWRGGEREVILF